MSYDFMIIGAGPAGYTAAIRAAHLGQKVLLAEEGEVGGTCLNVGCIPTKALIHASQLVQQAKDADRFGVHLESSYDPEKMDAYRGETVTRLRIGVESLLKANGVTLVRGHAHIVKPHVLQVGDAEYEGSRILIASGSVPAMPPIPGIQEAGVLTSTDLLNLPAHPLEHLCIIGGGVIGCEFANLFLNLGKKVTIIEAKERILPEMDAEISQNLTMLLKRRGAVILTGSGVTRLARHQVFVGEKQIDCDEILMAVGRRSRTDGLFAEGLLEMDHGSIKVDSSFRTSAEDIYACGDCVHGIQLAHYAAACAEWIVENLVTAAPQVHLDAVPACVYLNDEIACVGMSEQQAKDAGIAYHVGKYSMLGNSRNVIEKADRGFIKVLSDEHETVIGAAMMCHRAADMIPLFTEAVANRRSVRELSSLIYPHPGFAEGIREALEDTWKDATHVIYRKI